MSGPSSPATRFHDVEVLNDQTGAKWLVPAASIRQGLIILSGRPPRGFFDRPGSTFTITATDAGGRTRRFPLVTLDRGASSEHEFAFG